MPKTKKKTKTNKLKTKTLNKTKKANRPVFSATSIRLGTDLKNSVKDSANKKGVSVNAYINSVIAQHEGVRKFGRYCLSH